MGLFSAVKKAVGGITGSTAAKTARKAGRRQATAIMRGAQVQKGALPGALKDVVRGAREAGAVLRPYQQLGMRALPRMETMIDAMAHAPGYRPAEYTPYELEEGVEYIPREYEAPTAAEVMESPAVRFRMQEAERALTRRQAAAGRALGGGAQRELARYMQGLASQEYEAEAGRRFRQAGFADEQARARAMMAMQRAQLGEEQAQFGARFGEEQARFGPQFAQQRLSQRLASMMGIGEMGFQAQQTVGGIRERLGQMMAGMRTGSAASQAAAIQAAGQARASGAMAGAAARQQAMGSLMKMGATLGATALGGPLAGAGMMAATS